MRAVHGREGLPAPPAETAHARPRTGRMLGVTAAWGACFIAIRWGLRDAPTLWYGSLRGLVAGVALLGAARVRGRSVRLPRSSWLLVGVLGLLNVTLAFGAMFAGTAGVATGIASVLANAQPLLIVLPAWWLYGERMGWASAAGLAVGFAGLLLVAGPGGGGRGALLSLLAAVGITGGTLLIRRLAKLDMVVATGWHFLVGGGALALVALGAEGYPAIAWTPRFVASLLFLSLVGTAAAFLVWFKETLRSPLGALAAWTFLVPVFGIGFGVVILGERPSRWAVAGLLLVLASLLLLLRRGRRAAL